MKKLLIMLLLFFAQQSNANDTLVRLVAIGDGNTLEQATNQALRNALSQAFSVFISTKTTIQNDYLIENDFADVTKGIVTEYNVLSSIVDATGGHIVTIDALASISGITSYAKNSGNACVFDGDNFAKAFKANEILYNLNHKNALKVWENIVQICRDNKYDFIVPHLEVHTDIANSDIDKYISSSSPFNILLDSVSDIVHVKYSLQLFGASDLIEFKDLLLKAIYALAIENTDNAYGKLYETVIGEEKFYHYAPFPKKEIESSLQKHISSKRQIRIQDNLGNVYKTLQIPELEIGLKTLFSIRTFGEAQGDLAIPFDRLNQITYFDALVQ